MTAENPLLTLLQGVLTVKLFVLFFRRLFDIILFSVDVQLFAFFDFLQHHIVVILGYYKLFTLDDKSRDYKYNGNGGNPHTQPYPHRGRPLFAEVVVCRVIFRSVIGDVRKRALILNVIRFNQNRLGAILLQIFYKAYERRFFYFFFSVLLRFNAHNRQVADSVDILGGYLMPCQGLDGNSVNNRFVRIYLIGKAVYKVFVSLLFCRSAVPFVT